MNSLIKKIAKIQFSIDRLYEVTGESSLMKLNTNERAIYNYTLGFEDAKQKIIETLSTKKPFFNKWELIQENVPVRVFGVTTNSRADIYRKKKLDSTYKYKIVERY